MIKNLLENYNVILVSASSRRKELLNKLEIKFRIIPHSYDESYPSNLKGKEAINYISAMKVESFGVLDADHLIIGSDTAVYLGDGMYGKPRSREQAYNILSSLSGKKHSVITSVCLKTKNSKIIFDETTDVFFDDLTSDEIYYYLDNYQPYDKSGSYGIQDWIGCIGIRKIEGCFFNVMGLPLSRLYREIKNII